MPYVIPNAAPGEASLAIQLHNMRQRFAANQQTLIRVLRERLGFDAEPFVAAVEAIDAYDLFLTTEKAREFAVDLGADEPAAKIAAGRADLAAAIRRLETERFGVPAKTLADVLREIERAGIPDDEEGVELLAIGPAELADREIRNALEGFDTAANELFDKQTEFVAGDRDEVVAALFDPGTHRTEILAADYLTELMTDLSGPDTAYRFTTISQLVTRNVVVTERPARHAYAEEAVTVDDITAVYTEFSQAKQLMTRLIARPELAAVQGVVASELATLTRELDKFASVERRIQAILQGGVVDIADEYAVRRSIQELLKTVDTTAMTKAFRHFALQFERIRLGEGEFRESKAAILRALGNDETRFAALFGETPISGEDGPILPATYGVVPKVLRELGDRVARLIRVQRRFAPIAVCDPDNSARGRAVRALLTTARETGAVADRARAARALVDHRDWLREVAQPRRLSIVNVMAGWLHHHAPGFVRLATAMSAEEIPAETAAGRRVLPSGVETIPAVAAGIDEMREWQPKIVSSTRTQDYLERRFAYVPEEANTDRLDELDHGLTVTNTAFTNFITDLNLEPVLTASLVTRFMNISDEFDCVLSSVKRREGITDIDPQLAALNDINLLGPSLVHQQQLRIFTENEAAIKARFPGTPAEKEARYQDCLAVLQSLQTRQRELLLAAVAEQKLFLRGPEGSTAAGIAARKQVATAALIRCSEYIEGFTAALHITNAAAVDIYRFDTVEEMLGDDEHPIPERPADLPAAPVDGLDLTYDNVQASYQNYLHATQLIRGFFGRPEFAGVSEQWLGERGHLATLTQALNKLATAEAALRSLRELDPPIDSSDLASVEVVDAKVRATLANIAAARGEIQAAQDAFRHELDELRQQVLAKRGPVWQAIRREARTETEALNRARAILGDDHLSFARTKGILPTIHRELRARADHLRDVQVAYANPGADPADFTRRIVALRDGVYARSPGFYHLAEARGGEAIAYPRRIPAEAGLPARETAEHAAGGLAHIADWLPQADDVLGELPGLHDAPDDHFGPVADLGLEDALIPGMGIELDNVRRGVRELPVFAIDVAEHGANPDSILTRNAHRMRYYLVNLDQRLLRYRERVERFLNTIGIAAEQRGEILISVDNLRRQVDRLLSPARCREMAGLTHEEIIERLNPETLQAQIAVQFAEQLRLLQPGLPAMAELDAAERAARVADYQAVLQGLQAEHKALLEQTNRLQRAFVGDARLTRAECPHATNLIANIAGVRQITSRMLAGLDPWLQELHDHLNDAMPGYGVDELALLGQRPIDAPGILAEETAADLLGLEPLLAQFTVAESFLQRLLNRPELRSLAEFTEPRLAEIKRHLVRVADKDSRAESLFWMVNAAGERVRRTVEIGGVAVEVSIINPETMRLAAEAVQQELLAEFAQAFAGMQTMLQGLEWIRLGEAAPESLRARVVEDGVEHVAAQEAPTVEEFVPFQRVRDALLASFQRAGLNQAQAEERLRILLGNQPLIVGSDDSDDGFDPLPASPNVMPPAHTAAAGVLPNILARMMAVMPSLVMAQNRLAGRGDPDVAGVGHLRLERRNNLLAQIYIEQPGFYRLANTVSQEEFLLPLVTLPERRTAAHPGGLANMAAWLPDLNHVSDALDEFEADGDLPALDAVAELRPYDGTFERLDNLKERFDYFKARMERFLRAIGAADAVEEVQALYDRIYREINIILDTVGRDATGVDFAAALERLHGLDLDRLLQGEFGAEQLRLFQGCEVAIKAQFVGNPAEKEARYQDCLAIMRDLQQEQAVLVRTAHRSQREFLVDPALGLDRVDERRTIALGLMIPHDPMMRALRAAADAVPGYTVTNHQQLVGAEDFAVEPAEVVPADAENVTLTELGGVYREYEQARNLLQTILTRDELAPLAALVEPKLTELETLLVRIANAESRIRTILGRGADLNDPGAVRTAVDAALTEIHDDYDRIDEALLTIAQDCELVRNNGVIAAELLRPDGRLLEGRDNPEPALYQRARAAILAEFGAGVSPEVAEARFNTLFGTGLLLGRDGDDNDDIDIVPDLDDHPGVLPTLLREFQYRGYRLRDHQDDFADPDRGDLDNRTAALIGRLQREAPGFYRLADQVGRDALDIPGAGAPDAATTAHPDGIADMVVWQPRLTTPITDGVDALAEMDLGDGSHLPRIAEAPAIGDFNRDDVGFARLDSFNRRLTHYQNRVKRFLASIGIRNFTEFNAAFEGVRNRINVLLDDAARMRTGVSVDALLTRLGDDFEALFNAELQPLLNQQFAVLATNREVIAARFADLVPAGLDEAAAGRWRADRFADCQSIMRSLQREQKSLLEAAHTEQRRFLGAPEFDYTEDAAPRLGAAVPTADVSRARDEARSARRALVQRALVVQDRQFRGLARDLNGRLWGIAGPDGHGGELRPDHVDNHFGFIGEGPTAYQTAADRLLGYQAITRPPFEEVPGVDGAAGDADTINLLHVRRIVQEYRRAKELFARFASQPEFRKLRRPMFSLVAQLERTINRIATVDARIKHLLGDPPAYEQLHYERLADDAALRTAIAAELAQINDLLQPDGTMAQAIRVLAERLGELRRPGTPAANPERADVIERLQVHYRRMHRGASAAEIEADAATRFDLLFGRYGDDLTADDSRGVLPTVLRELRTSAQRLIDVQARIAGVEHRPAAAAAAAAAAGGDAVALQRRLEAMIPRLRAHIMTEAPGFYRLIDRTANADAVAAFDDQAVLRGRYPHPVGNPARFQGAAGEGVAWHEVAFGMHRQREDGELVAHDPYFMRHVTGAGGIELQVPAYTDVDGTHVAAAVVPDAYAGAGDVAGGFQLGHGILDCAPSVDRRAAHLLDDVTRYVTGADVDLAESPFAYLNAYRSEWQAVYAKQVQFFRNLGLAEDKIETLMQPLDRLFQQIDIVLSADKRQANTEKPLAELQDELDDLSEDAVNRLLDLALETQQRDFTAMQADVLTSWQAKHVGVAVKFADLKNALRGLQAEQRLVVFGAPERPEDEAERVANEAAGIAPRAAVPGLILAQHWFLNGIRPQLDAAPLAGAAANAEAARNYQALLTAYNPVFSQLTDLFADDFGRDGVVDFAALQQTERAIVGGGGLLPLPPPAPLEIETEELSSYADLIQQREKLQARLTTIESLLAKLEVDSGSTAVQQTAATQQLQVIQLKMQNMTELLSQTNKWKYMAGGAAQFKQDLVVAYNELDNFHINVRNLVDLPGMKVADAATATQLDKPRLKTALTVATRRFHEAARDFAQIGIQSANQPTDKFVALFSATSQTTSASYSRESLRRSYSKVGDNKKGKQVIGEKRLILNAERQAAARLFARIDPARVEQMRGHRKDMINWLNKQTGRILAMAAG